MLHVPGGPTFKAVKFAIFRGKHAGNHTKNIIGVNNKGYDGV